jgi:hypothetical protein
MTNTAIKRAARRRMEETGENYTTALRAVMSRRIVELDELTWTRLRTAWDETTAALQERKTRRVDDDADTYAQLAGLTPPRDEVEQWWVEELLGALEGDIEAAEQAIRAGYEDAEAVAEALKALPFRWDRGEITLDDLDLTRRHEHDLVTSVLVEGERLPVTVAHEQGYLRAEEIGLWLTQGDREQGTLIKAVTEAMEPLKRQFVLERVAEIARGYDFSVLDEPGEPETHPRGDAEAWFGWLVAFAERVESEARKRTVQVRPPQGGVAIEQAIWPDEESFGFVTTVALATFAFLSPVFEQVHGHGCWIDVAYEWAMLLSGLSDDAADPSEPLHLSLRQLASELAAAHRAN